MNPENIRLPCVVRSCLYYTLFLLALASTAVAPLTVAADEKPNACPVDGCDVSIVKVEKAGDELRLTFKANYMPDMSHNHIHVWWGDNFKVEQVTNDAETVHHVTQGKWHPTANYPNYVTQSGASIQVRGKAKTLCVSPADGSHVILDVKIFHCTDVSSYL